MPLLQLVSLIQAKRTGDLVLSLPRLIIMETVNELSVTQIIDLMSTIAAKRMGS